MLLSDEILVECGFTEEEILWRHEKGNYIYKNRLPDTLKDLVKILTGSAFNKGLKICKEDDEEGIDN